jgi:hypothetical protein
MSARRNGIQESGMLTRFVIGVLLVLTSLATLAAPRSFPPEARRGLMSAGADYTQVVIDGQVQHLAPGAKIKSKQKTIRRWSTVYGY